ncbi:hypothetical protein [Bradyrhizobium sp. BR 1432]|uniref:hypothetical protein n=1 Tax=Bradyrhizobium sp. BR 1432 TaxID=3447966 RepID=UPI003EE5E952
MSVVHGWQHQHHQCAQENADRANPSAGVAFAPDGNRPYVASLHGTVTVLDIDARRVAGAIAVRDGAAAIAMVSLPKSTLAGSAGA